MQREQINDNRLHNRSAESARHGGGAQAEPWEGVRRALSRQRNPRTELGPMGPTSSAPEHEAPSYTPSPSNELPRPTQPEADDTQSEGRGSGGLRPHVNELPHAVTNALPQEEDNAVPPDWSQILRDIAAFNESQTRDEEDLESDMYASTDDEGHTPMPSKPTPRASAHKRNLKGAKPGIRIASLNMRGRTITTENAKEKNKLDRIMRWMRNNNITILALIDTHWDEDYAARARLRHQKHQILCEHETTNHGGLAFIIDESHEKPKVASVEQLIPGRCALLTVEFSRQTIKLAAAYAPTNDPGKIELLRNLRKGIEMRQDRREIIIAGDWNMVEDERDRNPMHKDGTSVTEEMQKLKTTLILVDGWRETHSDEINFTFEQKRPEEDTIFARIDRIYIAENQMPFTNEWEILRVEKPVSDHHAVSVKILEPDPPFIGPGEWRLKPRILEHKHFQKETDILISSLEKNLNRYDQVINQNPGNLNRTRQIRDRMNPQLFWQKYKTGIRRAAKETETIIRKAINRERNGLEREARKTRSLLQRSIDETEQKALRQKLSDTEKELSELLAKHRRKADETNAAKWFNQDEKGSKLWYSMHKERPKRQLFHSLFNNNIEEESANPVHREETRETDKMMEIARSHHSHLQAKQPMTTARENAIIEILNKTENKANQVDMGDLTMNITSGGIEEAIRKSKNGKAPGPDGIPNEFWKQDLAFTEEANENETYRPNISELMARYLYDIENYGPINHSFAEGRMSLLYKKKDKREIANYRPITLLNSDYKLYTTALTARLQEVAPTIINPDQAGFMQKRSIYDQTKLTEMIIKLCENENRNGMILALDQEKAYDRIDHAYLWRAMTAYGIPESFIQKVRNLYSKAETAIRLNGCVTDSFTVERGVRQGDPLSCLLYNIAIEPLFDYIRASDITGIEIHKDSPNARLSAYADDTTTYLHESDSPESLMKCLRTFESASTAKFNDEKTEIIPIGSPEFRERLRVSRNFNGWMIPPQIRISKDGEAIRILGSWQGNAVNASNKWNEIIEKQVKIMKLWSRSYPSIIARARVAKSLVASRALYLMTVNGIENDHLEAMERHIRNFIWQGKRGPIPWEKAIQPKHEGGIGAPSVKVIYEATKIMWLKRWLTPTESRPKWAWAANAILEGVTQSHPPVNKDAITEWAMQNWHEKGNADQIPKSLNAIIRVARKHNVKISILRAPDNLKLDMPAFYHPGTKSRTRQNNNTKEAKCLRENHQVRTVRDLVRVTENPVELQTPCEVTTAKCQRQAERILKSLTDLWNPLSNSPEKAHYKSRKRNDEIQNDNERHIENSDDEDEEEEGLVFDPNPGDTDKPLENVRIFGTRVSYLQRHISEKTPQKPLRIQHPRGRQVDPHPIAIYTDGSTTLNGWENSLAGIGNFHEEDSDRNIAKRLQGEAQTNQRAELAAILAALRRNRNANLVIYSDSLSSIRAIGLHTRRWEDIGWYNIKNEDILKCILHELRTRPKKCTFRWVKAHAGEEKNEMADKLADEGRLSGDIFEIPHIDASNSRAIHDGARLSALTMRITYGTLIKQIAERLEEKKNTDKLEDTKRSLERETGLRPTAEGIIAGIWKLETSSRVKDHIWNLLLGRVKCGEYWKHITGYEEREQCSGCYSEGIQGVPETELHLWLLCDHNGQTEAWKTARELWHRTTTTAWPELSIELIRGIGALTFTDGDGKPIHKDSERARAIIATTVWAIWKARNKRTIQGTPISPTEAGDLLKHLLKEYITNSWNSLKFEKPRQRPKKEARLRDLWQDGTIVSFVLGQPPIFHF